MRRAKVSKEAAERARRNLEVQLNAALQLKREALMLLESAEVEITNAYRSLAKFENTEGNR